ncbi:MAG: hypothetical protein Q9194_007030 [Teloschistes cf. exilis]
MAVAGLLMFGKTVRDEITSNIFLTEGFPRAISVIMVIFIAIIPITKIPLKYALFMHPSRRQSFISTGKVTMSATPAGKAKTAYLGPAASYSHQVGVP